jgi:hypothetical protein
MRAIRILAMLAVMLATTAVAPAAACPTGYVVCGGACCPGR